ncbi:MAG: hypothetical protein Fur005_47260 [Roseiflexaceae bacterium]
MVQQRLTIDQSEQVRHLATAAARAVAGVATVASSDIEWLIGPKGLQLACPLTVEPDVAMAEVGTAVQVAIASAIQQALRLEVHEVNIIITDLTERPERPTNAKKNSNHA